MAVATTYDVVIANGRVLDPETGHDAVAHVGIADGRIAAVSAAPLAGRETVDASGLVVAPGFIDMHHHNAGAPFGQKLALRDGVTTPMELEAGCSPVKGWYEKLEGRSRTNFGCSVGTIPCRERVLNPSYVTKYEGDFLFDSQIQGTTHTSMKWSTGVATGGEIAKIVDLVKEGLDEGALGIGHCPGYMVSGVSTKESTLFQKAAGQYNVSTFVHGRFSSQAPPTSGLLGMDEMMAPQSIYGGGLVMMHLTAQTLDETPAALATIDEAREKGIRVLGEVYPYDFGMTIAGADYLHPENYQKAMCRDFCDIIEVSNMKSLTEERYNYLLKHSPFASVLFYNAKEDVVYRALAHPTTVVGSDSFPYTDKETGGPAIDWHIPFDRVSGHPRGSGTHAKMLRLIREKKVDIPLMLGVSKMTYMIADFLAQNGIDAFKTKGRIQVGCDADITVFDPATVTDQSTTTAGGLPSTGIPYVLVNGTIMVRDSKNVDDKFPGKAVRRAVS